MDIPTASPPEIDTEIARLANEIAKRCLVISQASRTIELEIRHPAPFGGVNQHRINQCESLISIANREINGLREQRAPLDDEFERRGWTRYYLVDSHNGHVHFDVSQSRCSRQVSTSHLWLTSESGKPAEEVVALAGERACTQCFPWAPTETRSRPCAYRTPSEIEQETRRQERAAKAAARAVKAITNPDGSPLRITVDGRRDTLATVRAAELRCVDLMFWPAWNLRSRTEEESKAIERILICLAVKANTTMDIKRDEINKKYHAKCKREGIEPS